MTGAGCGGWRYAWVGAAALCLGLGAAPTVDAAVEWVEIVERGPFAGGASFGTAGPYERIKGRLHYAVDPEDPANAPIIDLGLAPRDERGLVTFAGDFILLHPGTWTGATTACCTRSTTGAASARSGSSTRLNRATIRPALRTPATAFCSTRATACCGAPGTGTCSRATPASRSSCRSQPRRARRSPGRWRRSWWSGAGPRARPSCGATRVATRRSRWTSRRRASRFETSRMVPGTRSP